MAIVIPQIKAIRETASPRSDGSWDLHTIFNLELYPALNSIRRVLQGLTSTAPYVQVQEEGVALPQQPAMNFIGANVTAADDPGNSRTNVTVASYAEVQEEGTPLTRRLAINFIGADVTAADNPSNNRTDVTISPSGFSYILEWGAGDLGNAIGGNRVLHSWADGTNAPFIFTGRDDEGRGQKYILVAGTIIKMIGAIRGVQPAATDIIWTYTVRVDETDTTVTDNFNIRTTGPRQKITTGLSLHVAEGARISIRTSTDVASGTVSAPYVSLLFVPDP